MQSFKKYLNPLYKDLSEIANFSNISIQDDVEKEEYPQLENVTKILVNRVNLLLPKLDSLEKELEEQIWRIESESDLDEKKEAKSIYNKILIEIEILVSRINNELLSVDSPYFGKIVFQPKENRTSKPISMYIGKFALIDQETHIPLITDWRSPIANLYYENSGPKKDVRFVAPVGERKGDLLQKRQFQISRARISGIYDAKSGNAAADAFLLSQLNQRLGKKLQDIVSTIQTQQNNIIRDSINKPMLMQGVAGSGKTTILLHRLAYLFYTYKESINPANSLIIAPNQMFTDYVSDVLPNLGVHSVDTQTYLFWGKKVLGWNDYYAVTSKEENMGIKEYKGSLEFKDMLDEYFEKYEDSLLENIPYSRKDIIKERYLILKEQFKNIEMFERIDLAIEYAFAQKQFRTMNKVELNSSVDFDEKKKSEIKMYFRNACNIYNIYKALFKSNMLSKETCKYSLEGLEHKGRIHYYRVEDLAPMVYLSQKLFGTKFFEKDYVMVDEVQDMNYIQIATLVNISKNGNICLAGDLAQSIIEPFYIKEWNPLMKMISDMTQKDISYHQLFRCYRTTVEIVDFANSIFKERFPKGYRLPEAVLRHGDEVKILPIEHELALLKGEGLREIVRIIKEQFEKGAVTCAILCRNRQHADTVYKAIKEYEKIIERPIISYNQNDYRNGLLVLPIENAKGLEFDSVIFADFNSKYYRDNLLDIKLFYVGVTRALHRVYILTLKGDDFFKNLTGIDK